jgi:hypothetical protein
MVYSGLPLTENGCHCPIRAGGSVNADDHKEELIQSWAAMISELGILASSFEREFREFSCDPQRGI